MKRFARLPASCLICSIALSVNVACAGDSTEKAGNALAIGLPAVAAVLSLAYDDSSGFWQLARSEGATVLLTELLKSTTHEMRPNGKDNKSFPSGHSAVAFSAAQYMQMRGGWTYGIPAYLTASYVAYSRVHAKEHYTKDVLAGAALGGGMTYWLTDAVPHNTRLGFDLNPGGAAIQMQRNW